MWGNVWCLQFAPDGRGMFYGSTDGVLEFWDVSSLGEKDLEVIRRFAGHTVRILVLFLLFFGLICTL